MVGGQEEDQYKSRIKSSEFNTCGVRCMYQAHLVLEHAAVTDDILEDVFSHMRVHGRQRVVKQVHVRVVIGGPGQGDTLFLTA